MVLVREVVLIESGIAVELFRADVEHKRVAVEALFLEVSVHHQSGTCGNGDGSVAFSLTCYGLDADGGKVVVERCAARLQDGSRAGSFTCACQQVVGIVEGPDADGFRCASVVVKRLEGGRDRCGLVVVRVVGNDFSRVVGAGFQSAYVAGEAFRHIGVEVEL